MFVDILIVEAWTFTNYLYVMTLSYQTKPSNRTGYKVIFCSKFLYDERGVCGFFEKRTLKDYKREASRYIK